MNHLLIWKVAGSCACSHGCSVNHVVFGSMQTTQRLASKAGEKTSLQYRNSNVFKVSSRTTKRVNYASSRQAKLNGRGALHGFRMYLMAQRHADSRSQFACLAACTDIVAACNDIHSRSCLQTSHNSTGPPFISFCCANRREHGQFI